LGKVLKFDNIYAMALPSIPEFEDLLDSLTTVNPQNNDFSGFPITQEMEEKYSDGRMTLRKGIVLWHRNNSKLTIHSLIRKIESELKSIGHISNEQIAKTILLLFVYYKNGKQNNIELFNELISNHVSCEVSQYFILPNSTQTDFVPISFGEFTIARLDSRRFKYKCEKAGSDFFSLYSGDIVDKPSIERKKYNTIVINCHKLISNVNYKFQDEFFRKTLLYFESVSAALFEDFWYNFNEQQNLHISVGFAVFQDRYFREMLRSQNITIFTKIPVNGVHRGYVVPIQVGFFQLTMSYDLGPSIIEFYSSLKRQFLFSKFGSNEIHQTFKTFCRFVSKGYRYLEESRIDEGFLHFIIALDLVFGDKNESTKSVSNRCAVLVMKNSDNYNSKKKKVNELYDSRSKYVHAGLPVNREHIDEAKEICKQIVFCFLRLQAYWVQKNNDFSIEQWKKKIDYAWSALEAEEVISDSLRMEIGIE
jgi:hypothetical protein